MSLANEAGGAAMDWYVLRSKPRKEASAATLLSRAGIDVYLPQTMKACPDRRRNALEPLFPGYLFSKLAPEAGHIRFASYTPGVLYVLGYGGQPCPVPEGLIASLKASCRPGQGQAPAHDYLKGDRVVITSGPLRDVEAVFDCNLSATGRVHVLIKVLDRHWRAEAHVGQLRRAAQAAGAVRN